MAKRKKHHNDTPLNPAIPSDINKNPDDLQSITNHPGFQFETEFFQSHVCALYIIHSSLRSFQSQTARQESSSLTLISWKVVTVSTPVMVICA